MTSDLLRIFIFFTTVAIVNPVAAFGGSVTNKTAHPHFTANGIATVAGHDLPGDINESEDRDLTSSSDALSWDSHKPVCLFQTKIPSLNNTPRKRQPTELLSFEQRLLI